jgi:hypothetical protein
MMIVLAIAGFGLLIVAPLIARLILGRNRDSVALVRMIQVAAIAMLIAALIVSPYNRETTATPPPPDAEDPRAR